MRLLGKMPGIILRGVCVCLLCGCAGQSAPRRDFDEAGNLAGRGDFTASLQKYREIFEKYPRTRDRALFRMGMLYARADNEGKDYRASMALLRELVDGYPESAYRRDGEMMLFYLANFPAKDQVIAAQRAEIEALRQEMDGTRDENAALAARVEALRNKMLQWAREAGSVDRIVVTKGERRLRLIFRDEVVGSYRIALGGNPIGPKERAGDDKTPEGTYIIDSRNRDSRYHLSLHISYPNEKDRVRARELGVPPGGEIAIHGIKSGYSWVGGFHAGGDWTKGCIAVTDEEIDEIARLAPNGTVVEIRP